MKKTILLFFLSMNIMFLHAQGDGANSPPVKQTNKFCFGVETGVKAINSYGLDYTFIREEAVYYYGYFNSYSEISMMAYVPFVSLKAEYRALSDKLWLSTGIGYSSMNSVMGKLSKSQGESEYFYLMLCQNQDETYYYRIKEIREKVHYMGIPLDVRYTPFLPRFFRLYFKFGFEANFKISSEQSVVFHDAEMKKHEDEILDLFDQPNSFYAAGTFGVGIQLGKQDKPNIRIEADFPAFMFTPKAFGLMDHAFGGGGRISFVLPLKIK